MPDRVLLPGDIICTHTGGLVPWLIRRLSRSEWSHVALYIGGGEMVEALGAGVVRRSVQAYEGRRRSRYCMAWRPDCPEEVKARACQNAVEAIGYKYDYSAIWGIWLAIWQYRINRPNKKQESSRFFCSELVAVAFHQAGHDLFNMKSVNLHNAAPQDCIMGEGARVAGWPAT